MDNPTRIDLFALGRNFIKQRSKNLDPDVVDVEGSDANLIVGSTSVMGEAVLNQLAYRTSANSLDGSEGEDLDRWVWDRYRETRKGSAASRCFVELKRPSVALGAGTIPAGTITTNNNGVDFVLTTDASFSAIDLTSRARVRSVEAGAFTRSGPNTIRRWQKPNALFDGTITITNVEWAAGGSDGEKDADFKNRARVMYRASRRGILAAIELGALSVPGVVSALALEITTAGGEPARLNALYIADESGVASDVLASEVRAALVDYRAAGISVVVYTSLPQLVGIALKLAFRANVDTVSLGNAVRAAIVEKVNSLPVNAPLLRADITGVLTRYKDQGVIATDASVLSPIGDLFPDTGATLRTTTELVTLT